MLLTSFFLAAEARGERVCALGDRGNETPTLKPTQKAGPAFGASPAPSPHGLQGSWPSPGSGSGTQAACRTQVSGRNSLPKQLTHSRVYSTTSLTATGAGDRTPDELDQDVPQPHSPWALLTSSQGRANTCQGEHCNALFLNAIFSPRLRVAGICPTAGSQDTRTGECQWLRMCIPTKYHAAAAGSPSLGQPGLGGVGRAVAGAAAWGRKAAAAGRSARTSSAPGVSWHLEQSPSPSKQCHVQLAAAIFNPSRKVLQAQT